MLTNIVQLKACTVICFILLVYLTYVSGDCSYHCEAFDCPCDCYRGEVECGNKHVTKIGSFPTHHRYEILDFGNNKIKKLTKKDFDQRSMKHLQTLQLSANEIALIEDHSFKGLHHLHSIFLNSNEIEEITLHTFAGLSRLHRLYLNNNKIKVLSTGIFQPFKDTLELLYLQSNDIAFIAKDVFGKMKQLKTLDLSKNKITELDASFMGVAPKMTHLFLGYNPWSCEENVVCSSFGEISKRQTKGSGAQKLHLHDNMICQTPEKFQQKDMALVIQLFDCDVSKNKTEPLATDNSGNGVARINADIVIIAAHFATWMFVMLTLRTAC
ncbi:uncharacterized protein LOC143447276 [Clavelina lepadiformis]|uniref:uncharacterized protein LOC143447276 n=1 Tax=Clavelina lepadiformis TaxID=159417 RepID=UPI00404312BD